MIRLAATFLLSVGLALQGLAGVCFADEPSGRPTAFDVQEGDGGEPPAPEPPEPPKPSKPRFDLRSADDRPASRMIAQASSAAAGIAPSGLPEYILLGSGSDVARASELLASSGGTPLRGQTLTHLGLASLTVDFGKKLDAEAFRRHLKKQGIRLSVERNSLFSLSSEPRLYAGALLGAPGTAGCILPRSVRIGIVDGPVDKAAPGLSEVRLESFSLLTEGQEPAPADHGTGIVSLIAAGDAAGAAPGLARGATVFSAVAFSEQDGRSTARTDQLAAALDWLAGQQVSVINLSLEGPQNAALATVLASLSRHGIVLVAAAGNDGRNRVAFPASDPHVIGISAIDARRRLYHSANRGDGVDFVAPGVDLLVSEGDRASYRSGTSYAAAIATAVVAQTMVRDGATAKTIEGRLLQRAEDLGAEGWDRSFGWGLLKLSSCTED